MEYGNRKTYITNVIASVILLSISGLFFFLLPAYIHIHGYDLDPILKPISIQLISLLVGGLVAAITYLINYNFYKKLLPFIIIATVIAMSLLLTPLGIARNDVTRWVDIGVTTFQPSELLKLATVFFYAYIFSSKKIRLNSTLFYLLSFGGMAFIFSLSFLQPDYGTLAILLSVFFVMAFLSKIAFKWWRTLFLGIAGFAAVSFTFLPSYLFVRINVFFKLITDSLTQEERYGVAFHSIQNMKALSSGGFFGRGNFTGSLPEIETDSIFAFIGGEYGFLVTSIVVLVFMFLFYNGFKIAERAVDTYGMLLAAGITTLLASQVFLNILVVLGAPATGIPLLFISKGGTSLLFTFIAIGVLLNIANQSNRLYK